MDRFTVTDVGDGLCCGITVGGTRPFGGGLQTLIDWGPRSGATGADAFERLVADSDYFPHRYWRLHAGIQNTFLLSHYHTDHYAGLLWASQNRRREVRYWWDDVKTVFAPGMPDLPGRPGLRQEFLAALFTVCARVRAFGDESGNMDYDFVTAIRRLKGDDEFSVRQLYQGDSFRLGSRKYRCDWPPRVLTNEQLTPRIERALEAFSRALKEDSTLRDLYSQVRDGELVRRLSDRDGEQYDQRDVQLQRREPRAREDVPAPPHETRGYDGDVPEPLSTVNRLLRGIANELCLAFHSRDTLLFLGDVGRSQIRHVVRHLRDQQAINFGTMLAPHHGSAWDRSLFQMRANTTLVSNGSYLSSKYKREYGQISRRVTSTHSQGDLAVDLEPPLLSCHPLHKSPIFSNLRAVNTPATPWGPSRGG